MAFDYWTSGRASSKVPSTAHDIFLAFFSFLFPYVTKEEFLSGGIFVSDLKRGLLFESPSRGYAAKSLPLILELTPQFRKCHLHSEEEIQEYSSICCGLEHGPPSSDRSRRELWECTKSKCLRRLYNDVVFH
ncbi:hypothetical protein FPOAC2_04935 [Fusarium poae]